MTHPALTWMQELGATEGMKVGMLVRLSVGPVQLVLDPVPKKNWSEEMQRRVRCSELPTWHIHGIPTARQLTREDVERVLDECGGRKKVKSDRQQFPKVFVKKKTQEGPKKLQKNAILACPIA